MIFEQTLHKFTSHIELEGVGTYPDESVGKEFAITLYGDEMRLGDFTKTLRDYEARDENGDVIYRKVRGSRVPIYDVPNGIGNISYRRNSATWRATAWVSKDTVTQMLALLPSVSPTYISIHQLRLGRHRHIVGLSLQTTDPADD